MMQVTNLKVSFLRNRPPAQYETAQPSVEFAATLDEGDDHLAAARQLMSDAVTVGYAGLGYAVPEKIVRALATDETPTDITVNIKYVKANEPAQTGADVMAEAAEKVEEAVAENAEAEPKKRGRKKGSKNTRPKADTQAAEDHLNKVGEADEVPSDISSGEARIGPDDDPADHGIDGVPGDDTPVTSEEPMTPDERAAAYQPVEQAFTALDLHKYMSEAARDGKITVQAAKAQVLQAQGVARAQDLTEEQVIKGKKIIDLMIEAGANK